MSYLDRYDSRLRVKGTKISEVTINQTKKYVNSVFQNSPTFKIVKLNGVSVDTVTGSKYSSDRKLLLFRPDTVINIGDRIESDSENFLIVDKEGNDVYPTAEIKLCSSSLSLKGQATKTQIGVDKFNFPVYEDVEGEPISVPCIVETSIPTRNENGQPINLPLGQIKVTIPFTIHEDIKEGKDISLYEDTYEIKGIDKTQTINNVGLLILHGERL